MEEAEEWVEAEEWAEEAEEWAEKAEEWAEDLKFQTDLKFGLLYSFLRKEALTLSPYYKKDIEANAFSAWVYPEKIAVMHASESCKRSFSSPELT